MSAVELSSDPAIQGQEYCLITCVGPHCTQKAEHFAVKIRGSFPTIEAAKKRAAELSAAEGAAFDIYVVEQFKWIQLPPPTPSEIEDVSYPSHQNELLNDIIQGQIESKKKAQEFFEMRKQLVKEGKLDPSEELTFEELEKRSAEYQRELKEKAEKEDKETC